MADVPPEHRAGRQTGETMSERSTRIEFRRARRRVFREQPVCRACRFCLAWSPLSALVLCVVGAFVNPAAVQLFRGCLRLPFSSPSAPAAFSGPSCITRPMRNGRSSCGAIGEHRPCSLPLMALFFIPVLILRHHLYEWMNIPAGARSRARYQARLSELAFLSRPRDFLFRLLHHRRAFACAVFRSGRTGRQSRFTFKMRKAGLHQPAAFCPFADFRRLRLAR